MQLIGEEKIFPKKVRSKKPIIYWLCATIYKKRQDKKKSLNGYRKESKKRLEFSYKKQKDLHVFINGTLIKIN